MWFKKKRTSIPKVKYQVDALQEKFPEMKSFTKCPLDRKEHTFRCILNVLYWN